MARTKKLKTHGRGRLHLGETLRYRNKKGQYTKFSPKKKLVIEVWNAKGPTGRVLNRLAKRRPVPTTFKRATIVGKIRHRLERIQPKRSKNEGVIELRSDQLLFDQVEFHRILLRTIKDIENTVKQGNEVGLMVDVSHPNHHSGDSHTIFAPPMTPSEIKELAIGKFFEAYRQAGFRASPKKIAYNPNKPHVKRLTCELKLQYF